MKSFKQFQEEINATRKGRALGNMGTPDRPQATKAMSSGGSGQRGGMTMTPVTGLGRNFKRDKDKIKKEYDAQVKKDRKSAALDRIKKKM
ncbi:hypothetical protein [Hyphomonas sp. TMED31]|uniref:hypothetical protein n=1 Tax=Hyphomonas sp. TMED31 TaxID=1986606 RepID=UPI0031F51F91|tara:strand:- start:768 stop:1037 length:270 start_codon:yes stop_codon:yes gene_type:complete